MMSKFFHSKPKTLEDQVAAFRVQYPGFTLQSNHAQLIARGWIRPTARSEQYHIEITCERDRIPEVRVIEPVLKRNEKNENIPHMFEQKRLCLYRSIYGQYTQHDLLTDTIIPWSALWLYYYEEWHITGKWLGGGEHPGPQRLHA